MSYCDLSRVMNYLHRACLIMSYDTQLVIRNLDKFARMRQFFDNSFSLQGTVISRYDNCQSRLDNASATLRINLCIHSYAALSRAATRRNSS